MGALQGVWNRTINHERDVAHITQAVMWLVTGGARGSETQWQEERGGEEDGVEVFKAP